MLGEDIAKLLVGNASALALAVWWLNKFWGKIKELEQRLNEQGERHREERGRLIKYQQGREQWWNDIREAAALKDDERSQAHAEQMIAAARNASETVVTMKEMALAMQRSGRSVTPPPGSVRSPQPRG